MACGHVPPTGRRIAMSARINWDSTREFARRVLVHGEPLDLTEDTRALLLRTAQEVGIGPQEAEEALRGVEMATTLLKEAMRRINEGSDRITRALRRMSDLRDKGDLDGACQQMRDVLAVEVVPLYRKQADKRLEELTQLSEVAATGRVSANLPIGRNLPFSHTAFNKGTHWSSPTTCEPLRKCSPSPVVEELDDERGA